MKRPRRNIADCQIGIESLEPRQLLAFAGQVVAYLPDYEFSQFSKIDLTDVTHVNYFSVTASSSGALSTTSENGASFSQLQTVVAAAHAVGVTVSITVTVANTPDFQTIAASSSITSTFVNNIVAFSSTYHLDGIDLDYEPGTLNSTQKTQWGNLLAALHAQTSSRGLILTEAVQASQDIIPAADVNDLDWYYMMDYDLEANSSAPYSDSISYLTTWSSTYGVPKSKLLMGVPFYGRSAASASDWGDSQTETTGAILSSYFAANGKYPPASADTVTIGTTTWGFNNISTLQQKAQYILQNGYAGMMIWELGQDHFSGQGYDQFSLLPAIKTAMSIPWLTASSGASYSLSGTSFTATSGSFTFSSDASASNPNLNVTVGAGAAVTFSSTQHLASLTLNGGTASFASGTSADVIDLKSISITGGKLDLGANSLIVDYTGSSPIDLIRAMLENGYASGAWNGPGIISSSVAANHGEMIGFAEASTLFTTFPATFAGQSIDNTSIVARLTAAGDTNLDGMVNTVDFTTLASHFNSADAPWSSGDLNYDGRVNAADFALLAENYGQSASASQPPDAVALLAMQTPSAAPVPAQPANIFSDDPVGDPLDRPIDSLI